MIYQPYLYFITAVSNIHPGSGSQTYGIIDNLVQRDPITGFPIIQSSSLKGALREFFHLQTKSPSKDVNTQNSPLVKYIFGADIKDESSTAKEPQNQAGAYRFFDGQLLSLPVRSDLKPFFRVTCPELIRSFLNPLKNFNLKIDGIEELEKLESFHDITDFSPLHFNSKIGEKTFILEDFDLEVTYHGGVKESILNKIFGEDVVLVSNKTFKRLTDDNHLPVIPRNSLENGRSTNLWYEQILPRQTKLFFTVLVPNEDHNYKSEFDKILHDGLVQIGANASIGYGFSNITPYE